MLSGGRAVKTEWSHIEWVLRHCNSKNVNFTALLYLKMLALLVIDNVTCDFQIRSFNSIRYGLIYVFLLLDFDFSYTHLNEFVHLYFE